MKTRITIQDAKFLHCFCIGYCDAQYLLRYEDPVFYTAGIYWRKADFYKMEDPNTWRTIRISTWYGTTGDRYIDYDLLKNYEKKAQALNELMRADNKTTREIKLAYRRLFFDMLDHAES